MRNTPIGLRSLMAAALLAIAGGASGTVMNLSPQLPELAGPGPFLGGTARTRGKGGKTPSRKVGTKANKRAAIKARNVRRHRAACRA